MGEYVKVLVAKAVPPDGAAYQSTVKPVPTVAEIAGMELPVQYPLSPPLPGALMEGQLQLGAVTESVVLHEVVVLVAVNVMFVPARMAETVNVVPLMITVPDVDIIVLPALIVPVAE